MARITTFIAAAGVALLVAAPGFAKGQPVVVDPATEAQIVRGEALGRYYQRDVVGVDPATQAQVLRGQAMDRHFGLGRFAVDPATEAQIVRGEALGRYYQRDVVGVDPATQAQVLRGQAMDRHFGLGRFAVDPATEAQVLRGEAMDRHYALGRFSPRERDTDVGSESSPVSVTSAGSDLDWARLVAGLGIGVLLATGLLVAMRFTRTRPVGH